MKIQQLGKYKRYVVVHQDGRYWAGVSWVSSLPEARVFAEIAKAEKVIRVLAEQSEAIADGQKYVTDVTVTIRPDQWVSIEDLKQSLQREIAIFVDSNLDILAVEVDWGSLHEEHES